MCSWYLDLRLRLVCPTYISWHLWHLIPYTPLFSWSGIRVCFLLRRTVNQPSRFVLYIWLPETIISFILLGCFCYISTAKFHVPVINCILSINNCRSQWARGLRRGSYAALLLRLWVRIPRTAWMSISCECCVLSGTGLCDGLIIRPEESYRLCCVVVCDLETSWMRRPWPTGGLSHSKQSIIRSLIK